VAHCVVETYSVLTRLPAPHRIAAQVASSYLRVAFAKHALLALPPSEHRALVETCATNGLSGGAIYDALIGAACARLDARARQTYALLGVDHEMVA
jgi:hypothetical protein